MKSGDSLTFDVKPEIWNLKLFYKTFTNGDMFHDLFKNGYDPTNIFYKQQVKNWIKMKVLCKTLNCKEEDFVNERTNYFSAYMKKIWKSSKKNISKQKHLKFFNRCINTSKIEAHSCARCAEADQEQYNIPIEDSQQQDKCQGCDELFTIEQLNHHLNNDGILCKKSYTEMELEIISMLTDMVMTQIEKDR